MRPRQDFSIAYEKEDLLCLASRTPSTNLPETKNLKQRFQTPLSPEPKERLKHNTLSTLGPNPYIP